mmetsp:Transcript_12170/g.28902  ORF Transcript_12170/g.28902 Transcript_12170/m.28902 type:complete len:363 (-) Transcript_12170:75-1163(-)
MCRDTNASMGALLNKNPSFFQKHRNTLSLLMVSSGICCSYWLYGYLQEKLITKSRLGATFVLVIQTLANVVVATVWQTIERKKASSSKSDNDKKKPSSLGLNQPLLFLTSACYVFAMIGSNESLRFVPYPVAVLAKSCKLIPTMVMGRLIEGRRYAVQQWMAAFSISAGIALFNYSRMGAHDGDDASSSNTNDDHYWKGMALLCLSLGMDGFLGACQGMLKRPGGTRQQRPPTAVETMMFINVYSLLLLVPLATVSGQMADGIRLLMDSEQLRFNIAILNGVVAIGQIFIFLCIAWYSSLVTTTITTTRKFFTILFSVIHFGHSFTMGQWVSIVTVFAGLYLSIASSGRKKPMPLSDDKKKN